MLRLPRFLWYAPPGAHMEIRGGVEGCGIRFHIVLAVVGESGGIVTFFRGHAVHSHDVQLHEKYLLLSRIAFVRGKENRTGCVIHAVDREHLIVTALELASSLALAAAGSCALKL